MHIAKPLSVPAIHALLAAAVAAQDWTLPSLPTRPAAATFPRMAFDSQRARCVAFGGWNAPFGTIVFQDTWEYDGTTWTLRSPATVPDERDSHAMAYDSARGRTILFGGQDFNFVRLGETWEWDGTDWSSRGPANAPSARILLAMAYDAGRGVTVLFGGEDGSGLLGDTWEWNGTNWTQRTPAAAPPARTSHAMAYDSARGRIVLFGGADAANLLGDTWEYDGTTWVQVVTDGAPPVRVDHQLAYDLFRGRIVLFGGSDALIDRNDTWEYDGTSWRELHTANRPQGNAAMAMAFDSARGATVVFGGYDGAAAIPDTWELIGADATYRTFGTGCDGSNGLPPRLQPVSMPALGGTVAIDVADLPTTGGAVYLAAGFSDLVWNGNPLPLDLAPFGLPGCRGYTSAETGTLLVQAGGTANWSFALPAVPAFAGLVLFQQALSFDAGVLRPFPGATSNAAEMNVR
jgi:hypothetical protein